MNKIIKPGMILIISLLIIAVSMLIAEEYQKIEIDGDETRNFIYTVDETDTTEGFKLYGYDFEVNEIDVNTSIHNVDSMVVVVYLDYLTGEEWVNFTSSTISVETAPYATITVLYDSIKGASFIRLRNKLNPFDTSKTSGSPYYTQSLTLRNE